MITTITAIALMLHACGVALAFHALYRNRSSQAAIAWMMGLVLWPYVIVWLYLIFGFRRVSDFTDARRTGSQAINRLGPLLADKAKHADIVQTEPSSFLRVWSHISRMLPLKGNHCELLINGQATFDSILAGIRQAQHYVVVQFYIIKSDELGTALADALCERIKAGVPCWLLYDGIGSHTLSPDWIKRLQDAGILCGTFNTRRGILHRFRVNFRNHRKIVIVDGHTAWIGGHNVGDEYMGRDPKIGPWRDTHVKIQGPAALAAQVSFAEDWAWAMQEMPKIPWRIPPVAGNEDVLIIPTGPGDQLESATLMMMEAITAAKSRLWIASPYLVPDQDLVTALQLAATRGVDVRIMIPKHRDHYLTYLASFTYLETLGRHGVTFYAYANGFMHQKVVLVDDACALVGTANFDNRSLHINFEVMVAMTDAQRVAEVAAMLTDDFAACEPLPADTLQHKPFWFKLAASIARLASPIL